MKILVLIFFLSSFFNIVVGENNSDVGMIVDVIKSYDRPTAVVAKLCWRVVEKRNLMVRLMNEPKPVMVLFVDKHEEIEKFDLTDLLVLTDLSCHDIESFLDKADLNLKFKSPARWFFVAKEDFDTIPMKLRKLNILVNSEALIYKTDNDTTVINMVYRIEPSKDFRIENYGKWTPQSGFKISDEMKLSLVLRRKDLQGKPIASSLVVLDQTSKKDIGSMKNIAVDNVSKISYHHLKLIYDFINATTVLKFTDTWGYYVNKSWSGKVGDIIHGEADFCGTVSFITNERTGILTYLSQPMPLTAKFVFRAPSLSFQNNLYVLPFKSSVWLCTGGLFLLLIVIFYVNAKWEATLNEHDTKSLEESSVLRPNVGDFAILIVGAVTQQGSDSLPKGSLGRVVTFIMFLIFLFLYTSYSANIVALLQSSSDQIKTLTDLLKSRFELGVEDESYARHYFNTATDPIKKALYETKIAKTGYNPNFMNIEEGIRKVRNKDVPFAFHMNMGMGNKKINELFYDHEKCSLREIEYISNGRPWLCCSKASPYAEIYKIGAARINEHGLTSRMNNIFYVFKLYCNTGGGNFASVNMVDFHPVLLWLLYGMILSFILLGVEKVIYRKLKERRDGRKREEERENTTII